MKKEEPIGKYYFLFLLVLAFLGAFIIIRDYFTTIIIAFIVAKMFRPMHLKIVRILRGREGVASVISTLLVTLLVIIPVTIIGLILFAQINSFINDVQELEYWDDLSMDKIVSDFNNFIKKIPYVNYELSENQIINASKDIGQALGDSLLSVLAKAGGGGISLFTKLIIFLGVFSTVLNVYPKIINYFKKLSPLNDDIDEMYIKRIGAMSSSMIKSIFIISVIQGLITTVILAVAGVNYAVFWGLLAAISAMLPFGPGAISIPIGLVLILLGDYAAGIWVLFNSIVVISSVDNVLRPALAAKEAELHPMLTLIGILGGLSFFGFWGVVIGPILMIFFVTTLDVYQHHYNPNRRK